MEIFDLGLFSEKILHAIAFFLISISYTNSFEKAYQIFKSQIVFELQQSLKYRLCSIFSMSLPLRDYTIYVCVGRKNRKKIVMRFLKVYPFEISSIKFHKDLSTAAKVTAANSALFPCAPKYVPKL